ncbi:MAG: hypothetical protein WC974_03330, partial [Thermoplasmata archaeon]
QLVSDGLGGAIITWQDYRGASNYDIYAQRINSTGAVQWTADGVAISTATNNQQYPQLVSDGLGGAIITWQDYRGASNYDIYAQRINSTGAVQWTADGVAISTATNNQQYPQLVSDGLGGAIITWQDYRGASNYDIYAQRINSTGAVQWTANGTAICAATGIQSGPQLASDGLGGAIITWKDERSLYNIYAQRINSAGTVQWTANGVAISTASGDKYNPQIASDGLGGAIITWQDYRSGPSAIYAQRINSTGAVQWTANGTVICAVTGGQSSPQIVSDGSGSAIITWEDYRSSSDYDVYAQRINSAGTVQWTADGVAISTASAEQSSPQLVSDGSGGAIITWKDSRSSNYDIYAQIVYSDGTFPTLPSAPSITTVAYTDTDGNYTINWSASNYVTNYIIYENGAAIYNGTNTIRTYAFTNKLDGTYTYIVAAWNANGTSANSTSVAIIVDIAMFPSAPSITTTAYTDTDANYSINWTASNYVTNYVIYENGAEIFNGTNTTLSYAFTNKLDGTYTYAVKAWNINGTSANSTSVAIIVDIPKLPSVSSITTTAYTDTDANYSINWTASNYATNYIIYENDVQIFNGTNTTLSYSFTNKPDGTYTYIAAAWNANGTSANSTSVAIIVDIAKLPSTPSITTTAYTDTDASYSINWSTSNYVTNYVIYENGTQIYNGTNTTLSYAFTNKPDGTYTYLAAAWNANGTSANSTSVAIIVDIAKLPSTPSITTTAYTNTDGAYAINWTASNYAANYIIYENGTQIYNGTNTTYTYAFTDKSNGTYTYKVATWNINGTSANSTEVSVTVSIPAITANLPSVPSITTVSYTDIDGNYSINWTSSNYATNYIIYENGIQIFNATNTTLSYAFTGKSNGTYAYKIKSWNTNGTSANSTEITVTVSIPAIVTNMPSAPSITTVAYTDTTANYSINWTASNYVTNYIIYENDVQIFNGTNTTLSYSFTNKPDGTYTYIVAAWNANGTSANSTSVAIIIDIAKLPSAPSITTTAYTDTGGNYSINWTASDYASSYILYENNIEVYNGTLFRMAFTNKSNSNYIYKVKAWNANGSSAYSSEVNIIVNVPGAPNLPYTPTITTVSYTNTDGNYSVNWTSSAYATSYILYKNDAQIANTTYTYLPSVNIPNGTYRYKVAAWNANGTSANSSEITVTVSIPAIAINLPSTPSITTTNYTSTDGNYSINWTSTAYAAGYILYKNDAQIANTTYTYLPSVNIPNGTYRYKVAAWNENGTSANSSEVTIIVSHPGPNLPGTPTITTLNYTSTDGNYTINWTSTAYAAGYILYKNDAQIANTTYTYLPSVNIPNGTYRYKVAAWNANGTSANSSEITVTVSIPAIAINLPSTPSITTTNYTSTDGNYTINWTSSAYAAGYILYKNDVQIANTTYTYLPSVNIPNGTYRYKVAAWNENGTSANSSEITVTVSIPAIAINLPSTPSITTTNYTSTDGNYTINWTSSAYAAGYILYKNDVQIANTTYTYLPSVNIPNGTYRYKVAAWNENGTSANSTEITVTVSILAIQPNLPSAPSIATTSYTDSDGNYTINWTASVYADKYILEENDIEVYNGTALTYSFTGKSNGTYVYRVRAWNANGVSSWSASVTITVENKQAASEPKKEVQKKGFTPGFEAVSMFAMIGLYALIVNGNRKRRR